MEVPQALATVHVENEERPVSRKAAVTPIKEAAQDGTNVAGGRSEETDVGDAPSNRWVPTASHVVLYESFHTRNTAPI